MIYDNSYTFKEAVEDYMHWFRINGKTWQRTKYIIDAIMLPEFGDSQFDKLTTSRIRKWMDMLVLTASCQKYERDETLRKRKATVNRYLNILKAILNKAYQDGKAPSDIEWKRVKPYRHANSARVEYFELEEITKFVDACPAAFRKLVCGALHSGCRYSELGKLKVCDFNIQTGQIFVQPSKNGKARYVTLTTEGTNYFAHICHERNSDDLIFTRENGTAWKHSHQQRPFRKALERAKMTKNASFHSLRHTHASQLAMQGVELAIIAHQLGHCDSRMAERHYAHLAPSYVADRIRSCFPALGLN